MGRPPRISRDQVLDAARAAFTDRGFAATTLADIAGALHVSPAAILRYCPSKRELFAAAMSSRGLAVPEFVEELARVDASSDPKIVLRRFAEQFVPFMTTVIRPAIAVHMHASTLVVPFDTQQEETPPRRGLRIAADYFRRAMSAGVIRKGDPRALALLFVGHLQAYVLTHQVLNVTPVYPLDQYLDALFDLWESGAIRGGVRARKTKRSDPPRDRARHPRGRGGGAAVRAGTAKAETARPRRNAGGADGERRVARRRTRDARPRR